MMRGGGFGVRMVRFMAPAAAHHRQFEIDIRCHARKIQRRLWSRVVALEISIGLPNSGAHYKFSIYERPRAAKVEDMNIRIS